MILERFTRPSLYLGSIVLAWGIIMACMGIVKGFAGITVIRFLLGFFELVLISKLLLWTVYGN